MRFLMKVLALSMTLPFLISGAALADRKPTRAERVKIEAALKKEGYTRWEEIELDDGLWEVDDAIGPDGMEYDLKLDPNTLRIVRKERD